MTGRFLETVFLSIAALLPIMNPFSTAPLFVSLTAGFSDQKRKRQALLGCSYAFGILLVFLLMGSAIIDFFSISVAGIRVAGGLIVSTIGLRMLFATSEAAPEASGVEAKTSNIAFTPIAMPSLAGPGSISVVLSAAGRIEEMDPRKWPEIYAAIIIAMGVTLGITYLILRGASLMVKFLGHDGLDAMTRIFGFLLVCIGVQFLLTGVAYFFGIHIR
ncbi:multiple antibiotic resistance protein [Novosphingobium sp. PhB165]|uniref:MarC family NAAT transporter n=1 Tax=Novosphingobium sp. PhB165 TaxID=2485105 RepID=UPI0010DF48B7|nr:MarC family NAAT transporter [Novosphingobium sp. PhB165]TCM13983.1 multiple antibiotic resistance protein [Novosphingobium sp. PhB165]